IYLRDSTTGAVDETWRAVVRDPALSLEGFEPVPAAKGIGVEGVLMRADTAAMAQGWRLLAGAFSIDGELENAALLLSPELKIVKRWILDEIPAGGEDPRPKHGKFVHGIALLPDASLIYTFDGSVSLQRVDRCNRRLWSIPGHYHHAVTLDETAETVWAFDTYDSLVRVRASDGKILQRTPVSAIIAANPAIDILEIRKAHADDHDINSRNTQGTWMDDPTHMNDADPLPSALASAFPQFAPGDLLISARSLNLVFVMDPETLAVKWWRSGWVQRQHDPDWMPSGEIMVFDNRLSRDHSDIVAINPQTFAHRVLFDGSAAGFYSRIRGKHQLTDNGHLVITSSQQGWAFELDATGQRVFEVMNTKPGSDTTNFAISEMTWFPPDSFNLEEVECSP
ncbi:MAG: arylsulfotransferase family protein, partial [Magnetospiraceae bacterium]